jgi:site-specific recombinase XerD
MLTIYRRHIKTCEHRADGRKYRRCRCPIWVDGFLNGKEIREGLKLKDWEKAQQKIREWEAEGMAVIKLEAVTIDQSIDAFQHDAEARGLQESTLKKYIVLFKQLRSFAASKGLTAISQLEDLQLLRKFRESWTDGGISAGKKLERLRAFLRFAQESGWIKDNLARHLKRPKVTNPPTMPFTQDEMIALLAACAQIARAVRRRW